MSAYGILVDFEWCSGCHTCEVACQMEQGLPTDKFGVKLTEIGPWQIQGSDKYQHLNYPLFTEQCNLCAPRTAKGKLPSCVHHCQAKCLTYGTVGELAAKAAEKPWQMLFTLEA